MATWHQMRNPVPLDHETMWTVVVDPPHKTTVCVLFDTEQQAMEYKKTQQYTRILRPRSQAQ